jgi:flagellar M-ring protein FliF
MANNSTNSVQGPRSESLVGNGNFALQGETMFSKLLGIPYQPAVIRSVPLVVGALLIAVIVAFFSFAQKTNVMTIYDNLPPSERSKVLNALRSSGYSASVDPASGQIQIPTGDYYEAKLSLAGQGLPGVQLDGYGELESLPMGASKSVEAMKVKQSQEIEIARSIMSMKVIQAARVHLALPERSVFVREKSPPTASVFLTLIPGEAVSTKQVNAIVNLVAKSVSNLATEDVTVVDENGRLLTNSPEDASTLISNSNLRYRMKIEDIYRSRIEQILSPLVGVGNASAQVNIDIDTTRVQVTEELFDPTKNVIVSEQTSIENQPRNATARGIPGATSNRPPAAANLVQETDRQQNASLNEDISGEATSLLENSETNYSTQSVRENRSYKASKIIQTTRKPSNQILKIDTAVLLRKPKILDEATGNQVFKEYDPAKIAEIENLIKSTIGFQATRGDTLAVSISDFEPVMTEFENTWYETDWFKAISKNIGMVVMLAIVVFGIIRPLLNRLMVPISKGNPSMLGAEGLDFSAGPIDLGSSEGLDDIISKLRSQNSGVSLEMLDTANSYDDKVAIVKMLVESEGPRASNVLRQMMATDSK